MNQSRHLPTRMLAIVVLAGVIALGVAGSAAADPFAAQSLRGVSSVVVKVEGIEPQFARYGLSAETLRARTEQRLAANGLNVLGANSTDRDNSASQLLIRLYTNRGLYSNYSYAVSLKLNRKLALADTPGAFVANTAWSGGQNGVLNPSDLGRIYGVVDTLVDEFLAHHGRQNTGAAAAATPAASGDS